MTLLKGLLVSMKVKDELYPLQYSTPDIINMRGAKVYTNQLYFKMTYLA